MTIWKNVKYKTEGIGLNQSKYCPGRATEGTEENINLLQEKLIANLRISAGKNDLDIRKSTFNRKENSRAH